MWWATALTSDGHLCFATAACQPICASVCVGGKGELGRGIVVGVGGKRGVVTGQCIRQAEVCTALLALFNASFHSSRITTKQLQQWSSQKIAGDHTVAAARLIQYHSTQD